MGPKNIETEPVDITRQIKGQTITEIYVDAQDVVQIELGSGIRLCFPLTRDFLVAIPTPRYVN